MTNTEAQAAGPWPERGVILLAGPSGSGKGTVAARLLESGVVAAHLSMGQLLRDLLETATSSPGERATAEARLTDAPEGFTGLGWLEHCVRGGLLIPDAWTEAVVELQLAASASPYLRRSRWVLDGYPRTVPAAEHLLETLDGLDLPVWRVLSLELPEAEATARLLARGRTDDSIAAIRRRHAFYRAEVVPALRFLESRLSPGRVRPVNALTPGLSGAPAAGVVFSRVLAALSR